MAVAGSCVASETLTIVAMRNGRAIPYGRFATSKSARMVVGPIVRSRRNTRERLFLALSGVCKHMLEAFVKLIQYGLEQQDNEAQTLHGAGKKLLKMNLSAGPGRLEQDSNGAAVVTHIIEQDKMATPVDK